MKYKSIYATILVSLFILSMINASFTVYVAATIWTDKADYGPDEIVTIYGSGFLGNKEVTIAITAPDSSVATIYAETDGSGAFTAQYKLNGMLGTYTVTATDGASTAATTFTEGTITPELWGYTLEPSPGWTHGDVKGYYECEWVPYKIEIENSKEDSTTYTLTVVVHHDYFDGTYYGLDDVRNWQMWRDGVPETPSVSGPTVDGWESGIQQLQWSWTFITTSTKTPKKHELCTLTFEVHVAIGAHNYPGSKVHTHIHSITSSPSTSISCGHRDVPVVVKAPAPEADVAIQKTGVNYAHEGDSITYQFTVTNYGPGTALNVHVTDNLLGDLTGYLPDTTLDAGKVNTFSVDYVVPTPSDDITNTVTVSSTTSDPDLANNQASWTVDVLHPCISVSKSGPLYAHEGDTITYTITVSNTGDCPLSSVSVTDSLLEPIYSNGLAFGETKIFTVDYTIPTPSGDITNTVTAIGSDILGMQVSDSASWLVKVQYQITVTANPAGAIGGTFKVTYTKCGITYTDEQHTTTWTEWVDSGTTVTVSNPQDPINDGPGTRYVFDHYNPSASVTMTGSAIITLVYKTQYYLTVLTFPEGLQPTPTPQSGWYDECTYVTLTAPSTAHIGNIVYNFGCWQINGKLGWAGENPITIHMDSPKIACARYCELGDPIGDVNLDGKVDMIDIATIARHYGAKLGEPNYSVGCDLNLDGKIDIRDLAAAAINFSY